MVAHLENSDRQKPVIRKALDFTSFAIGYARRFGLFNGLRLALSLRNGNRSPGELFTVMIPGLPSPVWLRAGTSDRSVVTQIFVRNELEFPIDEEVCTIVDAGANIGLASLYFHHRFPEAKIISLEIHKGNFDILKRNTAAYPQIDARHVGLWHSRANLRVENPDAECWAFQATESSGEAGDGIQALGVWDLVQELDAIDLLKIDIEGGEVEVFGRGVEKWLGHVRLIAIETHDRIHKHSSQIVLDATKGKIASMTTIGEYLFLKVRR